MQLLPSLVSGLKAICATFPDARKGRGGNIEIADFGLAAFSMFFMQSASFLAYQRALEKGQGRSNGQTLFGIGRIPSDNYIRDRLDEADPALLQPCFERMETLLAEPAMRQAFGRLGGRTLIAWDGTQYFCSQKLSCPNCLTRERSNGKLSLPAVGHCRGAWPFQGRPLDARIRRQPGRRRETGLRTQRRQTLVRQSPRSDRAVAPDLSRRRSVRLSSCLQDGDGRRRRFHVHLQADLAQSALRLHRRRRGFPPRGEGPPAQHERDIPLPLDRGRSDP